MIKLHSSRKYLLGPNTLAYLGSSTRQRKEFCSIDTMVELVWHKTHTGLRAKVKETGTVREREREGGREGGREKEKIIICKNVGGFVEHKGRPM